VLYTAVLLAHSWLRWIVVALALWVLVTSLRSARDWRARDERRAAALVGLADLQMFFGLALWLWLSPIPAAAWRGGFGEPVLLVFGIVHPALMIVATTVLHAGHARVGRAPKERKHRLLAITVVAWMAVVALAIPWPVLPWGRPLARVEIPATASAAAPATWARCATCHGTTGRGDGLAAAGLSPRPRSFADRAWQARATDAAIRHTIRYGGATVGLSAGMPAHDVDDTELTRLVSFIRAIGKESP
jgi:hypothetical protein